MNFGKVGYLQVLKRGKPIVIVTGPAGTGKTYIACREAKKNLKEKRYDRVIITRPNVTCDEQLGYLPGTFQDKLMPYLYPIFDNFDNYLKYKQQIEITPLSFIRGRTFKNSYIIADEMQNSTPNQMNTLLTRIGEDTRIVVTGDLQQSDLKIKNGLEDFIERTEGKEYEYIDFVKLGKKDIKRHELIKEICDIYNNED